MALLTLYDMYIDVFDRIGIAAETATIVMAKRWLNARYKEVCSRFKWPFLQNTGVLTTIAEYTTGTVDVAAAGTTVTGTSTVWTKDMVGRKIKFDGWSEIHTISAWTSATSITITPAYRGTAIDDGTYTIFQDEYLCPWNWQDIIQIRQYRSPKVLDKISINEMRQDHEWSYPVNADPQKYCLLERRRLTKINIDTLNLSYTYKDILVDHWFKAGTSLAIGWVKRSSEDISGGDYLYLEILYGTLVDNETLTFYSDVGVTATGVTCAVNEADGYTDGNVGDIINLLFYEAPYRVIKLDIDYTLKPYDMASNDDEPLIPEKYRDMLVLGACSDMAIYYRLDDTVKAFFESRFTKRFEEMSREYPTKSLQFPQIIPVVSRKTFD
jgi:hypothetical protein